MKYMLLVCGDDTADDSGMTPWNRGWRTWATGTYGCTGTGSRSPPTP